MPPVPPCRKTTLRDYWKADRRRKFELLYAASLLAICRLGVGLGSVLAVRRLLALTVRCLPRLESTPNGLASAVAAVCSRARWVDHCLVAALVTECLLRRTGHPARLRIGFGRDASERIAGHAWTESNDAVVICNRDLHRFPAVLAPLD